MRLTDAHDKRKKRRTAHLHNSSDFISRQCAYLPPWQYHQLKVLTEEGDGARRTGVPVCGCVGMDLGEVCTSECISGRCVMFRVCLIAVTHADSSYLSRVRFVSSIAELCTYSQRCIHLQSPGSVLDCCCQCRIIGYVLTKSPLKHNRC